VKTLLGTGHSGDLSGLQHVSDGREWANDHRYAAGGGGVAGTTTPVRLRASTTVKRNIEHLARFDARLPRSGDRSDGPITNRPRGTRWTWSPVRRLRWARRKRGGGGGGRRGRDAERGRNWLAPKATDRVPQAR
jgi:hypothetical protein